jgi:hypothetical protein
MAESSTWMRAELARGRIQKSRQRYGRDTALFAIGTGGHPDLRCRWLSHRQSGRADHTRQLLTGNRRRPVTVKAIGPGRRPRQLTRGESRRMNLNDDVVYRCLRLGPLHQFHPGRSRSMVRHNDRFHGKDLLGHSSLCLICSGDNPHFNPDKATPKAATILMTLFPVSVSR